jgi:hypothetical protein
MKISGLVLQFNIAMVDPSRKNTGVTSFCKHIGLPKGRNSSVGIVTRLRAGQSGF